VTSIGELGTTLAATSNRRMLQRSWLTANVIPSSPMLVTLMMDAISASETSVLTRATQHNIPEDGILHSHHCENLKSYKQLRCFEYPFIAGSGQTAMQLLKLLRSIMTIMK
jgi:hypothetical protein